MSADKVFFCGGEINENNWKALKTEEYKINRARTNSVLKFDINIRGITLIN